MNEIDIITLIDLTESSVVSKIVNNEWNRFADVGKIMSNGMKSVLEYSPNITIHDFAENVKDRVNRQLNPIIDRDNPKVNYIFKKIDDWEKNKEPNVASLYECMLIDDEKKPILLDILRKLIKGKKGKDVALVILVCVKYHLMTRPQHTILASVFGDIGVKSGYNDYYKNGFKDWENKHLNPYTKDEINHVEKHLSNFLMVDH